MVNGESHYFLGRRYRRRVHEHGPQVAMGALLDPAVPRSDRKAYYRLRGMFSQKIVDFVAQRKTDGQIVAVIGH